MEKEGAKDEEGGAIESSETEGGENKEAGMDEEREKGKTYSWKTTSLKIKHDL